MTTLLPAPAPAAARWSGRPRGVLIAVALLVGLLAGCGTTTTPAAPLPATPAPTSTAAGAPAGGGAAGGPAARTQTVVIKNYLFVPDPVSVPAGATVMVDNQDGSNHTVTATDGSFDTGNIPGHATGRFTAPSKPGSYPYKCAIHPFMKATLTVT